MLWKKSKICFCLASNKNCAYAEKSAAPVAALVASLFSVAPHTAPLCPSNVPIQSPVSPCLSIGLPSENQNDYDGKNFQKYFSVLK